MLMIKIIFPRNAGAKMKPFFPFEKIDQTYVLENQAERCIFYKRVFHNSIPFFLHFT